MVFANSVVGGTTLVRPAIQSPNFVTGSTGWTIRADGSAEFNNVVIRNAATIGGTTLIYSGVPAAGNLIASVSAASGTDSFGNTYTDGMAVYDPGAGAFASLSTSQLYVGAITGGTPDTTVAGVFEAISDGSAYTISEIRSPKTAAKPDRALLDLYAGVGGQGVGSTTAPIVRILDILGTSSVGVQLSGAAVKTTAAGVKETWQTPSYNANWAGTTTYLGVTPIQALRYRMDAEDNVWFNGAFTTTAAGAGALVFQVAAAYRPATAQFFPVMINGTVLGNGYMSTSGNFHIDLIGNNTRNNGDTYYVDAKIALGNIP